MPGNGAEHNKSRPCRRYLCCMLTGDRNAGLLLDYIVGWHPHAKLRRKGKAGLWNAKSRAEILAGTGLTPKQWRRAKPLLEGYAHLEGGGFGGKRSILTQPTALTKRFLGGEYRTKAEARKALAALRQDPLNQDLKQNLKQAPQVPVGAEPGHYPGHNEGHNLMPSTPFIPVTQNQTLQGLGKEKPGKDGSSDEQEQIDQIDQIDQHDQIGQIEEQYDQLDEQEQLDQIEEKQEQLEEQTEEQNPEIEDDAQFEQAMKQLQAKKVKKDLKLYPEVDIPKGCPLVHPAKNDPGRWVSLSHKVKRDLYKRFRQYLENWKAGKAGKHAASVYGFGSYGGSGKTMSLKTIPKHLEDDDPELAALDAELAKSMATLDDLDEAA